MQIKHTLPLLFSLLINQSYGACENLFSASDLKVKQRMNEEHFKKFGIVDFPDIIYQGEQVLERNWTSAVALTLTQGGVSEVFCSGTAINPTTIITAAHCVESITGDYVNEVNVYVGNGTSGGKFKGQYSLQKAVIHPKYLKDSLTEEHFDFAVLVLSTPIEEGQVDYVKMLDSNADLASTLKFGTEVSLVGFGYTETRDIGIKVAVPTTVTSQSILPGATEIHLGGGGVDACQGDSGGPAYILINGELNYFGVTSRGPDCGSGTIYGLAQSVKPWIEEVIGFKL